MRRHDVVLLRWMISVAHQATRQILGTASSDHSQELQWRTLERVPTVNEECKLLHVIET